MGLILVSNRLPVTIELNNGTPEYNKSIGGLTTALSSYSGKNEDKAKWVGWPGMELDKDVLSNVQIKLEKDFNSYPVFLNQIEILNYYEGFCNEVIWPLFHYFPSYSKFDETYWQKYREVNKKFSDQILEIYKKGDLVFIQDYHLMLLPSMLRREIPQAQIGFFLHIPFPVYEIFKILPVEWRTNIVQGLLGADLVAFHTEDYTKYFLQAVNNMFGLEHRMGRIFYEDRIIKTSAIPLGIDFDNFYSTDMVEELAMDINGFSKLVQNRKLILSVDRLDYTKGIINRLESFEYFLRENKKYLGKVSMLVIAAPSREDISRYKYMNRRINEVVGRINGEFGDLDWTPIIYQNKSFSQDELKVIYRQADVALITPLRDGMNLIAKEYIASRPDQSGVLILSELAGAAKELTEAVLVNPNSKKEVSTAIEKALDMPIKEQRRRNKTMQKKLKSFDVNNWFSVIYDTLNSVQQMQIKQMNPMNDKKLNQMIIKKHTEAKKSLLMLDYDGTLMEYKKTPPEAKPTNDIINILEKLTANEKNTVALISGREKNNMEEWFGKLDVVLFAEHGMFAKENNGWKPLRGMSTNWKPEIQKVLKSYNKKLPGTFIEEKEFALAWHYRNSDLKLAKSVSQNLIEELSMMIEHMNLQIMRGNKVVEIKNAGVDKGSAALTLIDKDNYDFILAMGDDVTDEDMFSVLPSDAISVKVGGLSSQARYRLEDPSQARSLLTQFAKAI